MCGIAGFTCNSATAAQQAWLEAMNEAQRHRGPDDRGSWLDPEGRVGLAHTRLSILDLSPLGHQPMASADQRYQMVYNGEAYNYLELRQELSELGHRFRGNSDTEVLLAGFCQWGPEETVARINGMFALALYDRERREVFLARDRLGKKPLYYGWLAGGWVFASELKALRALPHFSAGLDPQALALYLRFGYVPCPLSIYAGIAKLPPGCATWLGASGRAEPRAYRPWKSRGLELEQALAEAVERRRLASDVPLGAFLSGGIDSSLVVALMQEQSTQPVRTFTLGFRDPAYDEAVHARAVARHLGTEHTEHYVTAEEALAVIPRLPQMYDEPFADSSQIPTYLVSALARQQVTVVLTGDGGDELFGGYVRHQLGPRLWGMLRWFPPELRLLLGRLLSGLSTSGLGAALAGRVPAAEARLTKALELLSVRDPWQLYKDLCSPWRQPHRLLAEPVDPPVFSDGEPLNGSFAEWMMRMDQRTYLPDDILVKVDRASMAVSLEARCPLLDPEVAACSARMELRDKIRGGKGKWCLRQLLARRVPGELFERPKAGFALPMGRWLRNELRPWAEELLRQIPSQGILREGPIRERWAAHQAGKRDWSMSLWTILMLQAWIASGGA